MEIYTSATLAERCFLFEALLWIAFKQVPIWDRYPVGEDIDRRFRDDYECRAGEYANTDNITPEDCERVGLPPNPAYEHDVLFEGKVLFYELVLMDEYDLGRGKINHRELFSYSDEDISHARELRNRSDDWLEDIDIFLMEAKLSLALRLLRGGIPAFGRFCRDPKARENLIDSNNYEMIKFNNAPPYIFQFNNIDWNNSIISYKESKYFDVCIDTTALFCEFPIGDTGVVHAHAVADALIVEPQTPSVLPQKRRGRPSFPWPEMYVELGRRAERGELPAKQEALIAEMMDWCQLKWGRRPSRSAIQSHLPPDIAKK